MIETWRREVPLHDRAIDQDMTDLTFDVLQATIFEGATAAEAAVLKQETGNYLAQTSWDIAFEMLRVPEWVWHPGKRPMRRSAEALQRTVLNVITRERESHWASGGLMASLGRATDPETGQAMPERQIASNLLTFAAAGHETTAKALTWALYLLARAPEWQELLHEEVTHFAGRAALDNSHIEALQLTRQVLKEAMRLYPPAPVLARMAKMPVTLGDHRFDAGTLLIMPIYVIHRHHNLWRDPDLFDPMRFTAEAEKLHARGQYIPFGFGPRTCIGLSFAMIETVTLLATLVRAARFSCEATLAPEPVSRVTLRPRDGMKLRIEMRNS